MPLHDWSSLSGWEGVHQVWMVELLYFLQPRLPTGYRAYIGATPAFAIDAPPVERPNSRPDVGVAPWKVDDRPSSNAATSYTSEPDQEIAVAALEVEHSLLVERAGQLVAAIELVSPRNKDRPSARVSYASANLSYLFKGVHLLLVDVHPRPLGFSFADQIATELGLNAAMCRAPLAVAYRVGEPAATGGRLLARWTRALEVGAPLPELPLPLTVGDAVTVDLEGTYARAAAAAYLS